MTERHHESAHCCSWPPSGRRLLAPPDAAPLVDAMRGPTPIPGTTEPPGLGNAGQRRQPAPAQLREQPPDHPAPHRRLPGRQELQQVPGLPCARRAPRSRRRSRSAPRTTCDRSGKVLDEISTRRYFCKQCHVAQDERAAAGRATDSAATADGCRRRRPARSSSERPLHARAHQAVLERHSPAERALQPGLPDAGRLHRRHRLLGRLQHGAWSRPTRRPSAPAATRCATTCSSS